MGPVFVPLLFCFCPVCVQFIQFALSAPFVPFVPFFPFVQFVQFVVFALLFALDSSGFFPLFLALYGLFGPVRACSGLLGPAPFLLVLTASVCAKFCQLTKLHKIMMRYQLHFGF